MDLQLEREIIIRFITAAKRERCLGFLSNVRSRDSMLTELRNPAAFDERCVTQLTGRDRSSSELLVAKLRGLGLGGRVYVMSANDEWDGKKFQTSYILEQCLAQCVDTLGYCWKTGTAFYEWHHSGATYFLKTR